MDFIQPGSRPAKRISHMRGIFGKGLIPDVVLGIHKNPRIPVTDGILETDAFSEPIPYPYFFCCRHFRLFIGVFYISIMHQKSVLLVQHVSFFVFLLHHLFEQ